MKHNWTVLCKDVLTNTQTGTISLINVLEKIIIKQNGEQEGKPEQNNTYKIPFEYCVVSNITNTCKSDCKITLRIRVLNEQNQELGLSDREIDIKKSTKYIKSIAHFTSFIWKSSGIHFIEVSLIEENGKKPIVMASLPIEVVVQN